ncbi:MAG: hypothetical protein ACPGO5_00425 [Patescibacteria group bacterium]
MRKDRKNRRPRKSGKVIQGPVRNTKKKPSGKKRTKLIKADTKKEASTCTHGLIIGAVSNKFLIQWLHVIDQNKDMPWLGDFIAFCKTNHYQVKYARYTWAYAVQKYKQTVGEVNDVFKFLDIPLPPAAFLYGLRHTSRPDGTKDYLFVKKVK